MLKSIIVQKIMFDYANYSIDEITDLAKSLSKKLIRWIAINHPDNFIRKRLFQITGIYVGAETIINMNFVVSDDYENLLHIGDRVAISPNVTVICSSGPNNSELNNNQYVISKLKCQQHVIIENDVWIGANSVILPGVRIGCGSIIGAGAIVVDDIPANCIVAGVPARVIRKI